MLSRTICGVAVGALIGACGQGGDVTRARYAAPVCGNDLLELGEACDDGERNSDGWALDRHCNSDCSGSGTYCGDGFRHAPELCDDGERNSDSWDLHEHCNTDCTAHGPHCGDGIVAPAFEVCDDGERNGDGWALDRHCNSACSGWPSYCGDGLADSREQCDHLDLKGQTCQSIANGRGQLACSHGCVYDLSDCHPYCGNGVCDYAESTADCPADCWCGDRSCNVGENAVNCPADCVSCGDGACTMDETLFSCPADCGAATTLCGNGTCDLGENRAACPLDCDSCGDGTCADNEDQYTCPADCGAVAIERSCVLLADGSVRCWGVDYASRPIRVDDVTGAVDISVYRLQDGEWRHCARRIDGAVVCWQAGEAPSVVEGLTDATDIDGPCAVRADGTVACWTTSTLTPVVGASSVAKIFADDSGAEGFYCAVLRDRTVRCWWDSSDSAWAQLPVADAIAVSTAANPYGELDAPVQHCALQTGGALECHGGITDEISDSLRDVGVLLCVERTFYQVCVARQDGSASCGGLRWDEQPFCNQPEAHALEPVPDLHGARAFSTSSTRCGWFPGSGCPFGAGGGYVSTCALLRDGRVACWGRNCAGGLGAGPGFDRFPKSKDELAGTRIVAIAMSRTRACAVMLDGNLKCWGDTFLGNGASAGSLQAVAVPLGGAVAAVAVSDVHACAALEDGSVSCWGENEDGQLGPAGPWCDQEACPEVEALSPVDVPGVAGAISVATGVGHSTESAYSCAVVTGGVVVCWGGVYGSSPVAVEGLASATKVVSGAEHVCALMADRTVECWGCNWDGQLGQGTDSVSSSAAPVVGLSNVVDIAAHGMVTCALTGEGVALCWGSGIGVVPVEVVAGVRAISAGSWDGQGCQVLEDGTVRCSVGARSPAFSTADGRTIGNAALIASTESAACAVLDDNTVKCWGRELGASMIESSNVPIPVAPW